MIALQRSITARVAAQVAQAVRAEGHACTVAYVRLIASDAAGKRGLRPVPGTMRAAVLEELAERGLIT